MLLDISFKSSCRRCKSHVWQAYLGMSHGGLFGFELIISPNICYFLHFFFLYLSYSFLIYFYLSPRGQNLGKNFDSSCSWYKSFLIQAIWEPIRDCSPLKYILALFSVGPQSTAPCPWLTQNTTQGILPVYKAPQHTIILSYIQISNRT